MKYVYASRSGNVEELVHILGLEAMKIKDGTETMDQDFILFTYTDGRGVVPPVVTAFLKENHSCLKGVIVSGICSVTVIPSVERAGSFQKCMVFL